MGYTFLALPILFWLRPWKCVSFMLDAQHTNKLANGEIARWRLESTSFCSSALLCTTMRQLMSAPALLHQLTLRMLKKTLVGHHVALCQWFPTFLISRPHSKILHECSALDVTYNSKDVRITSTDKIRNTIISRVGFNVFTFTCKRKQHLF